MNSFTSLSTNVEIFSSLKARALKAERKGKEEKEIKFLK